MKNTTISKLLAKAYLNDVHDEAKRRYGDKIVEKASIKKLGVHRYLFQVKKCKEVPKGFSELIVSLTPHTAEANGWLGLFRSTDRVIIDL